MLTHMQLKFKTDSFQQQGTMASLPKAIRSSIAQHLFLETVEKVYLFRGTSYNFLTQLVCTQHSMIALLFGVEVRVDVELKKKKLWWCWIRFPR